MVRREHRFGDVRHHPGLDLPSTFKKREEDGPRITSGVTIATDLNLVTCWERAAVRRAIRQAPAVHLSLACPKFHLAPNQASLLGNCDRSVVVRGLEFIRHVQLTRFGEQVQSVFLHFPPQSYAFGL